LREGAGAQWDSACVAAFQIARRKMDGVYEG